MQVFKISGLLSCVPYLTVKSILDDKMSISYLFLYKFNVLEKCKCFQ